jgi:probable F420-dependent oxidoreductase
MRVGLALPHYDGSFPDGQAVTWDLLLDSAVRAEALGFDSVWISDHFFLDLGRYGLPGRVAGSPEPFTALAAIAARTSRVRLGTLVACAPFRNPGMTAKMSTAIDLLSGGRFELGLGAGWLEAEFTAFGYPYPSTGERFRILEGHVEAIAALFGGGPVTMEGQGFALEGAFNHPAPQRAGGPPIWVGGKGGPRMLRLVARHAAGWNTVWRWTPEAYAERVAALREVCEREGRDPATVRLSVGLLTLVGDTQAQVEERYEGLRRWSEGALDGTPLDAFAADTLTGTVEACVDRLGRFAELGVQEVILSPASRPFAVFDWSVVETAAASLIPAVAGP